MEKTSFAVIGCGVQGLSTALLLLHQGAKKVTVVSSAAPSTFDKSDPTFASPKAGANWQTFASDTDHRQQEYDESTYYMLWSLSFLPQCGIMRLDGFQFFDEKPRAFEHPWYARFVKGYGFADASHLPATKGFGLKYETVTLNVPKYLAWLVSRVKAMGGVIVGDTHLDHWEQVMKAVPGGKADVVINCSALGSLKLGGVKDAHLFPVRGQTILVRAPHVQRTISTSSSFNGYKGEGMAEAELKVTYVIPREDGIVILGGTYQKNNDSMEIDPKIAESIMTRCIDICPELVVNGKLPEIVEHSVGLRPAREGGCRLDAQYLATSAGKEVLFINNYGHGGYGYQSSWGCAASVVKMVRRAIGVPQDDKVLTAFLKETVGSEAREIVSKL